MRKTFYNTVTRYDQDVLLPAVRARTAFLIEIRAARFLQCTPHIKIDTCILYKKNFLCAALNEAILGYSHRNNDNDNLSEP